MNEKTWQDKAHRIIAALCLESYSKTNTKKDGGKYKTHRPYIVPQEAEILIECLNTNDEHRAKSMFVWDYKISKLGT